MVKKITNKKGVVQTQKSTQKQNVTVNINAPIKKRSYKRKPPKISGNNLESKMVIHQQSYAPNQQLFPIVPEDNKIAVAVAKALKDHQTSQDAKEKRAKGNDLEKTAPPPESQVQTSKVDVEEVREARINAFLARPPAEPVFAHQVIASPPRITRRLSVSSLSAEPMAPFKDDRFISDRPPAQMMKSWLELARQPSEKLLPQPQRRHFSVDAVKHDDPVMMDMSRPPVQRQQSRPRPPPVQVSVKEERHSQTEFHPLKVQMEKQTKPPVDIVSIAENPREVTVLEQPVVERQLVRIKNPVRSGTMTFQEMISERENPPVISPLPMYSVPRYPSQDQMNLIKMMRIQALDKPKIKAIENVEFNKSDKEDKIKEAVVASPVKLRKSSRFDKVVKDSPKTKSGFSKLSEAFKAVPKLDEADEVEMTPEDIKRKAKLDSFNRMNTQSLRAEAQLYNIRVKFYNPETHKTGSYKPRQTLIYELRNKI